MKHGGLFQAVLVKHIKHEYLILQSIVREY